MQGDLSGVERELDASDDELDQDRLAGFRARFVERTEGLDLEAIEDEGVRAIAAAYEDFWRDVLLDPGRRVKREVELIAQIRAVVDAFDTGDEDHAAIFISEAELERFRSDPGAADADHGPTTKRLIPWIEKRGLKALTGRTAPHLDLLIWKKSRREIESVELTDSVEMVPVTYLEDWLVGGWLYYATLDVSRAGGWATTEGLFVVSEGYDSLEGEAFQISFLKHETRHFADASKYPKLSSADREYRAKLTELVYAQTRMMALLAGFARHSAKVDVPHPLANWWVMNDLAAEIFGDIAPEAWWTTVDPEAVRAAARIILKRNTRMLDEADAKTTEGVIRL